MKERIIAVIPARAGSVRVKNKNLQKIDISPLIDRKIQQLNMAEFVSKVVVGTNSPECMSIARHRGADILHRDDYHCDEQKASANEMIFDISTRIEGDIIVWSHCTNPFFYHRHYDSAIQDFLSAEREGYDSVISVQKIQSHMWNDSNHPVNYDPYIPRHTLAKDLKPVFFQDGGIFIQRRSNMIKNSYFFGGNPKLVEVEFPYCHDINTQLDLDIARSMVDWLDSKEGFREIEADL